jgi:hypothetical protein
MAFDRFPILYESLNPRFAETKVITALVATGNFKFVKLETCDVNGTAKTYFAAGERVYFNSTIRNDGPVEDGAKVEIIDVDTATRLKLYGTVMIAPGASSSALSKAEIGVMPAKDWKLQFVMTP